MIQFQERLESSRRGRAAITGFLVLTLACIAVSNLPASPLRERAAVVAQPYLDATGLDQAWRMFAPNPRSHLLNFEALIHDADGGTTVWRPPTGDPLLGTYRGYRWQKWTEHNMPLESGTGEGGWDRLWHSSALYAAHEARRTGGHPTRVTLVVRTAPLLPPGPLPDHPPLVENRFYRLDLPEPALVRPR